MCIKSLLLISQLLKQGTYHPRLMNDIWRRYMTYATLSRDCIEFNNQDNTKPGSSNEASTCNACGYYFSPIWSPSFFGNMFTARCDYIQRLIPPQQFKIQADNMTQQIFQLMHEGRLTINLMSPYQSKMGWMTQSRYADERTWSTASPLAC